MLGLLRRLQPKLLNSQVKHEALCVCVAVMAEKLLLAWSLDNECFHCLMSVIK